MRINKIHDVIKIYDHIHNYEGYLSKNNTRYIESLFEVINEYDAFLLDSFGVLNLGNSLIPKANKFLTELIRLKKHFLIITNGASKTTTKKFLDYKKLGLRIEKDQIVSSRDVYEKFIFDKKLSCSKRLQIGVIDKNVEIPKMQGVDFFHLNFYQKAFSNEIDYISFLGATNWNKKLQDLLNYYLSKNNFNLDNNLLLVGNPDVIGPWENKFSLEPGYWIWSLTKDKQIPIKWFGKPYQDIFILAYDKLKKIAGYEIKKNRIAMIGDTLHTDILGANLFGINSILLTNYGFFRDTNFKDIIKKSKIKPMIIANKY